MAFLVVGTTWSLEPPDHDKHISQACGSQLASRFLFLACTKKLRVCDHRDMVIHLTVRLVSHKQHLHEVLPSTNMVEVVGWCQWMLGPHHGLTYMWRRVVEHVLSRGTLREVKVRTRDRRVCHGPTMSPSWRPKVR